MTIKSKILYSFFIIALFLTPLLMPNDGKDYSAVATCLFVISCYLIKAQSILKIFIPIILFSIVMPIGIHLTIAKNATVSWSEAISTLLKSYNAEVIFSFLMPTLFSLSVYFLLLGINRLTINNRKEKTT